jgi:hypothetical protein
MISSPESEDLRLRMSFALREHLWFRMLPAITSDHDPSRGPTNLLRPRLLQRSYRCRNINLLVITYALRPRLRSRLTPGGLTWPGKPWVFGERVSHSFSRYSLWHNLSSALQSILSVLLHCTDDAPLPLAEERILDKSEASVPGLSPVKFSAQTHLTSELLRFL